MLYWRFLRYASLRSKWIGIFHPLALCTLRTLATSSISFSDSLLACPDREGLHLENYRFVLSELLRLLRLVLRIRLRLISLGGGLHLENYSFILSELLRLLRLVLRIRLWLISQMKNPLDFPPCSSGLLMIRMSIYNSKCSVDLLY